MARAMRRLPWGLRAAWLQLVSVCIIGLPVASADFLQQLGKEVQRVNPEKLVQELQKHPEHVASEVDKAVKHVDKKAVQDTIQSGGALVKEAVPGASKLNPEQMNKFMKILDKAGPDLILKLSKTNPETLERVLNETDPDKVLDLLDKINEGEWWVDHWPWFLLGACVAATVTYLAVKLVRRMWRRRQKTWSSWTPQRAPGTDKSEAEEPWIMSEEGSPSLA